MSSAALSSGTPSWATKVLDASTPLDTVITTSTRQSAELFRIECARTWQQRIHQAQRRAWMETVKTMLQKSSNRDCPQSTVETEDTSTTPLFEYYSLDCPAETDYSDELLPMTIVKPSPACSLDRKALVEAIWDHYSSSSSSSSSNCGSGKRCCTVWLPKLLPTLHATLHFLVRQCLHVTGAVHDADFQRQAAAYFHKHQKKRHTSMQQILLWWAARTSAFDSMVIVLENPGGFAQAKVWNEFLQTVQEWRQDHGLPVSLIVLGTNVPVQGEGAMLRLRHVTIDRSKWLQTFWQELLQPQQQQQATTPFPLTSTNRLLDWIHNYSSEHGSVTRVCQELEYNVTEFYSQHSSQFAWDAPQLHPAFLAWFATYGTAKKWLSTTSGSTKYTALKECHRIQQDLNWWWKWQVKLLPLLMTVSSTTAMAMKATVTNFLLRPLAELYSWLVATEDKDRTVECSGSSLPFELELYLDRSGKRTSLQEDDTESTTGAAVVLSPDQIHARTLLYELIILIGTLDETKEVSSSTEDSRPRTKLPEHERIQGIFRMIHDLLDVVVQSMDSLMEDWKDANPFSKHSTNKAPSKTSKTKREHHRLPRTNNDLSLHRPCHHRHNLVEALVSPAKEMYGLLQGRWSIPREEWLYQFGGSPQEFMRGVWTLVLTGLVQSKTKRGGKEGNMVYYEKVSVVWC